MSSKQVSLSLHKVGRKPPPPVSIEIGQTGTHPRRADTCLNCQSDDPPPCRLSLHHLPCKIRVNHQVRQTAVSLIRLLDSIQKHSSYDTTSLPNPRQFAQIQIPPLLLALGTQQIHSLGVTADFGSIEGLPHIIYELLLIDSTPHQNLPNSGTRRSSPPLVWKDRPFPPRPPLVIHRDPNAPRIRFPLPESENPNPLRRKRFNPDLERLEFERPWREIAADDRIDDSWSRDPRSHLRSHDLRRQVRRRTFPSDHFNDFDSIPMVGSHGHGSVERGIVERNPFERLNVQERISGIGGRVEAPSSSGFFSNYSMEGENEVGIEDSGIRVGYGKRFHINKMGKGKRTMVQANKPQKISALLRIQGGSNMNRKRNDEQFVQSSYFGDSNAAASQGESPVVFSDDRVKKVSSPVELDVSFKSDSLVAKAIFPTNNPSTGSNKQSLIKIKKKKKKVVDSVSHVPTSEWGKIDSKVTASSSHRPMKVSEKAGVSKAGPVAGSAAAAANDPGLISSQSRVLVPLEDNAAPAVSSVKENPKSTRVVCVEDDAERLQSNGKELATFDMILTLSGIEGDRQEGIPAGTATDCREVSVEVGDRGGNVESVEQTEVGAMEEHENSGCSEKCQDTAELHSEAREELGPSPLEVESLPTRAMEGDGCDQIVEEGLHQSDDNLREAVASPISTSNYTKEDTVHVIDRLSRIDFPESLPVAPEVGSLNEHQSFSQVSDENGCMDNSKQDEETADKDDFSLNDIDSAVPKPKVNEKPDDRMLISSHVITEKKLSFQSLTTKRPSTDVKLASEVLIGKRIPRQISGISGSLPPRAGFGSGHVKEKNSSTRIGRPRTWRRTDSSSTFHSPVHESGLASGPTDRQSPKRVGKVLTPSYIRKGNSLVRKSTPVAVATSSRAPPILGTSLYRSNAANEDTLKSCMVSKRNVDCTDSSTGGGGNPSFERPKTPPLSQATKSVNCMTEISRDSSISTLADPLTQAGLEIPAHAALDLPLNEDVCGHARTPENQAPYSVVSNLGTQRTVNDRKLKSPRTKKVMYVKRKSNQLVAAPRPEIRDSAVPITEKTHAVYFKRRKNQLVRNIASLKSQAKQVIAIPDDGSNSEGQSAPEISTLKCSRGSSKRLLDKVLEKTCKPSKFALVWTLSGSKSHHKDNALMQRRKVLPCLFPWKRTTYRRSSISNITPVLNKGSSSLIKKLKLSQQRDTLYTRSTSGFSLRKSRVLSIGGSSLKWSKSIERRSKKASEEATLAVAAAERKKREQKRAASTAKVKDGNPCVRKSANGMELQPGERIFCVGSVRYKMDSSKRTLLRIPDEESSSTVKLQSEKGTRISFVPRRLLIGNDEYIRIGNGNQLVRDPKRLTRILASEKIRWSLHTARLRIAKKQQYCQFFTRFGKCNKDDGKCPYIHDPTKVAVCTKFLKGRCSSSNCKLTHKVIPERMPDCSYFLKGLCTNGKCPYRHVNVNSNASVCEGFLRGYCADGDECHKKHSYVCPVFEANGMCPQGSACKLHHPNTGNKSRKRKRLKDERKTRRRYFGSVGLIDAGESEAKASDDHIAEQSGDIFFCDGRYADYIGLDFSDEEAREINHLMDTTDLCEDEPSESLDSPIKPVHFKSISQHDEDIRC